MVELFVLWNQRFPSTPWDRPTWKSLYGQHPNYELIEQFRGRIESSKIDGYYVYSIKMSTEEFAELIFRDQFVIHQDAANCRLELAPQLAW